MHITKTLRVIIYIVIYAFVSAGFLAMKIYFKVEDGHSYNISEFNADIPRALIMGLVPTLIPIVFYFLVTKRRKNANMPSM
jgi:hypothetical protein